VFHKALSSRDGLRKLKGGLTPSQRSDGITRWGGGGGTLEKNPISLNRYKGYTIIKRGKTIMQKRGHLPDVTEKSHGGFPFTREGRKRSVLESQTRRNGVCKEGEGKYVKKSSQAPLIRFILL